MRIFRIFSVSGEPEFVRECDLETVLCGSCHGALRKESRQESDYSRRESFLLRCQKCGGSYGATSLTDEEARQFFKEESQANAQQPKRKDCGFWRYDDPCPF